MKMDGDIKYLLKFGEQKYIKDFPKGSLYCSNVKTFKAIENDMKIKGQGDAREGTIPFSTNKIEIDEKTVYNGKMRKMMCIPESANYTPVYCLYAVLKNDCIVEDDGKIKINISKNIIRSHFPNANSVAVIKEPKRFMKELEASIDADIMSGLVHYFFIDGGLMTDNGLPAIDLRYAKFITNDRLIEDKKAMDGISLNLELVDENRLLFAKDIYFKDEQEFRIILKNKEIETGKIFPFKTTLQIPIIDIDIFFNEMCVNNDE